MASKSRNESDFLAKTYRDVAESARQTNEAIRQETAENRRVLIQDLLNRGENPLSKEKKTR